MHQGSLRVQDPNQNILTVMILEHLFGRLNCKQKIATKKLSHFGPWNIFVNFPRCERLVFWLSQPSSPESLSGYISQEWIHGFWRSGPRHPSGTTCCLVVKKALHKGNPSWNHVISGKTSSPIQISSSLNNKEAKTTEKYPRGKNFRYVKPRAPSRLENSELLMAECPKTSDRNDDPVGSGGQKLPCFEKDGRKRRPQRYFLQKKYLGKIETETQPTENSLIPICSYRFYLNTFTLRTNTATRNTKFLSIGVATIRIGM